LYCDNAACHVVFSLTIGPVYTVFASKLIPSLAIGSATDYYNNMG